MNKKVPAFAAFTRNEKNFRRKEHFKRFYQYYIEEYEKGDEPML
jgi:hypothetical protein